MTQIVNWSGSVRFRPRRIYQPSEEGELAALVRRARMEGRQVRVLGSSHSSSGILETPDYVVTMGGFRGMAAHDSRAHEASFGSGTIIEQALSELYGVDLAPTNTGDVTTQTLVGAFATGTHGTGRGLNVLAGMLVGGRMVNGEGEVVEVSIEEDEEFINAARVGLGALGIFTQVRLRLLPGYRMRRREYCAPLEATMAHLDELVAGNRHFDFYWYPRADVCKLRMLDAPGAGVKVDFGTLVEDRTGWAHQVLPKHNDLIYKYEEMEYGMPLEAGRECFLAVRKRLLEKWRAQVGWRVLWRTIAADNTFLSMASGRDTVTIALLQNATLPHKDYFADMEPILRDFGGRPHWGKKHTLQAEALRPLYPRWDRFQELRRRADPEGVFLNDYLRGVFGEESPGEAGGVGR